MPSCPCDQCEAPAPAWRRGRDRQASASPHVGCRPRSACWAAPAAAGRAARGTANLTTAGERCLMAVAAPWLGRLAWDKFCLARLVETSKTHFSVSRDSTENERFRARIPETANRPQVTLDKVLNFPTCCRLGSSRARASKRPCGWSHRVCRGQGGSEPKRGARGDRGGPRDSPWHEARPPRPGPALSGLSATAGFCLPSARILGPGIALGPLGGHFFEKAPSWGGDCGAALVGSADVPPPSSAY
jgi:hypothetical protein